jgi:hypothetical protein
MMSPFILLLIERIGLLGALTGVTWRLGFGWALCSVPIVALLVDVFVIVAAELGHRASRFWLGAISWEEVVFPIVWLAFLAVCRPGWLPGARYAKA